VRAACDDVINLRLPASMRAALDAEARASGVKLSAVARTALAAGLKASKPQPPTGPDDPPPSSAAMRPAA
jgi:hypothetical protein